MTSVKFSEAVPDEPGAVAMLCASLGWRVFPLTAGGDRPAIREWQIRATTDPETIQEWWGWSFHNAGVAIATGKESGIWVLDLDVKNGLNGPAEIVKLQRRYELFPETWVSSSRSGGLHVYWAWSDGSEVRNSVGTPGRGIAPGVDVRGEGGYVRAPTREADILISIQPTRAPDWLLQKALRATRPAERSVDQGVGWSRSQPDPDEVLSRSEERLAGVDMGGRNDALNRAAFLLARWSHETGVTRDGAWSACESACRRNGLWEDDGPDGCQATFNSGWNAGAAAA